MLLYIMVFIAADISFFDSVLVSPYSRDTDPRINRGIHLEVAWLHGEVDVRHSFRSNEVQTYFWERLSREALQVGGRLRIS